MKLCLSTLIIFISLSVKTVGFQHNVVDTVSTVKQDTLITKSSIDSIINYTSVDSIVYSIKNRKMMLYGKGEISYKQMKLLSILPKTKMLI